MTAPYGRGNPAEDEFQLGRFLGVAVSANYRAARAEVDARNPGPIIQPPVVAVDMVTLSPLYPHALRYTSANGTAGAHQVNIPISTLMQPDPVKSGQLRMAIVV